MVLAGLGRSPQLTWPDLTQDGKRIIEEHSGGGSDARPGNRRGARWPERRVAGHPDAAGTRDARLGRRSTDTVYDASDAAFETANKAAAPVTAAGGAILAVWGVVAAVMPRHLVGAFVFGGVGIFLVFCLLGVAIGVRASRSVP